MLSFWLTIGFGVLTAWLGLLAAYYSVYPVGFFITTFGFAGYVLSVAGRYAVRHASRLASRRHAVVPA
jgi:zinc/manganese transport system permease protein